MTVYTYTNPNGRRYIKVRRIQNGKSRQVSIPIPTEATSDQLAELMVKANQKDKSLFPHPAVNFLDWYWARGRPRNIYIDRTNLRLELKQTLVTKTPLAEKLSVSIGLSHCGLQDAATLITNDFFKAHGAELASVSALEFKTRLAAWLVHNYNH